MVYNKQILTGLEHSQTIAEGEERWGQNVKFSITTNATLLSGEKVDWLVAHEVKLEISIDGTATFHDHHRIDKFGKGSFSWTYPTTLYCSKPCTHITGAKDMPKKQ